MSRQKEIVSSNRDYDYDINRRYLSLIGQWPYQKPKEKLFFFLFCVLLESTVIVPQMATFFVCENMQCIFEAFPPYMVAVINLVKIFTYHFNSQKMKDLIDRLFLDWDKLGSQEEYEIMKQYTKKGRQYAVRYTCIIYMTVVLFLLTAFVPSILDVAFPLNTSRPLILPCPVYYFIDEERYFYYIVCHILVVAVICINGLIAHDCMFFTYIEHVCGLFAVVGFRFEHMLYKRSETKENLFDRLDDMYCKDIALSVHIHRKALQFAELIENTFSVSLAIQMIIITSTLSLTLLQTSVQLHYLAEAMRYILFTITQLFHLFLYSFLGQKLIDHSLVTCDKIYNGSWYNMPAKAQRLLVIAMRKSIEASTLSAGKMYIFSLQSFTTIVQTSVSYFTVLTSTSAVNES